MTTAEKISIALPPEMVTLVRSAVVTGEYASSNEVIRDTLRDWMHKRSLPRQGKAELRQLWQEVLSDKLPLTSAASCVSGRVFDVLTSKLVASMMISDAHDPYSRR